MHPDPPAPNSFVIRQVTRNDLPALEWDGEYIHFRNLFASAYRDARRGRNLLWVAALPNEQKLIGQAFVQLKSANRPEIADGNLRAYIFSVRVRQAFHNRGIGSRIMTHVESDLAGRGFQYATLNVAVDNARAYRFYVKRGYYKVADEPGQWSYIDHRGQRCQVNEPAWRMEKLLLPA